MTDNTVPFEKYSDEEFLRLLEEDENNPRAWKPPPVVKRNLKRKIAIEERKPNWRRVKFTVDSLSQEKASRNGARAAAQVKKAMAARRRGLENVGQLR